MSILDALEKERYSETAQVKFKPSEYKDLAQMVEWLNARGYHTSRSGVIRAIVVERLAEFKKELNALAAQGESTNE